MIPVEQQVEFITEVRSFLHAFLFKVDKAISWANLENLLEDRLGSLVCYVSLGARLHLAYRCHHS